MGMEAETNSQVIQRKRARVCPSILGDYPASEEQPGLHCVAVVHQEENKMMNTPIVKRILTKITIPTKLIFNALHLGTIEKIPIFLSY